MSKNTSRRFIHVHIDRPTFIHTYMYVRAHTQLEYTLQHLYIFSNLSLYFNSPVTTSYRTILIQGVLMKAPRQNEQEDWCCVRNSSEHVIDEFVGLFYFPPLLFCITVLRKDTSKSYFQGR